MLFVGGLQWIGFVYFMNEYSIDWLFPSIIAFFTKILTILTTYTIAVHVYKKSPCSIVITQ